MGEKHMERVEDDFLKTNNCTQEELDINMFDIKNSLMSCVEETTDGDCCRVIPIFNGDNHKEKVMFFYKEKNLYYIGLEHEFFTEYIICGHRKHQVGYRAILKGNGKQRQDIPYQEDPKLVLNKALEFFFILCKYTDSLHSEG